MRKIALSLLVLTLLITGCVHKSPFVEEYYFQAMGEDSEIVITADVVKAKEKGLLIGVNDPLMSELLDRSERVSLALYQDSYSDSDPYPADIALMDFYGAFEGNFPKLTNTALSWSEEFHKEKSEGVKYYTNDAASIEVAVPKTGVLLFASKDYEKAYNKTIKDRVIYIPEDTAKLLGDAVFGLYVQSPETMFDLGFELPKSVVVQMRDAIIYVLEKDGVFYLNADITMDTESLAKTLNTLLRNQVVAEIRREGERPDFKLLSEQYKVLGDVVSIRDRIMSDNEVSSFMDKIKSASGGLI